MKFERLAQYNLPSLIYSPAKCFLLVSYYQVHLKSKESVTETRFKTNKITCDVNLFTFLSYECTFFLSLIQIQIKKRCVLLRGMHAEICRNCKKERERKKESGDAYVNNMKCTCVRVRERDGERMHVQM